MCSLHGALLVHFEESVSPHSVCFLGNHCSADPFFRRGATDVCLWREKSARQRVHMVRGALSRAPRRGIREPAALAPPRVRTSQARRKPGTHNGCLAPIGHSYLRSSGFIEIARDRKCC